VVRHFALRVQVSTLHGLVNEPWPAHNSSSSGNIAPMCQHVLGTCKCAPPAADCAALNIKLDHPKAA
jgi:hypothetical protein